MNMTTCPTCGAIVTVESDGDGACHYEPVHVEGVTLAPKAGAAQVAWEWSVTLQPDTTIAAQDRIVRAVARRGYLNGWTDDELAARQLVKELEEVCEAFEALAAPGVDGDLRSLMLDAVALGQRARHVFVNRADLFKGATVNTAVLSRELADMIVPLAVLADALAVDDMMAAGVRKAEADVARGVRV